jgi:carbon storage regulator
MLILTRKKNESLIINGNIEVSIVALDDGKVKIGIDAPRSVEIHRKEVFDKIQNENKESIIERKHLDDLKKFIKKE